MTPESATGANTTTPVNGEHPHGLLRSAAVSPASTLDPPVEGGRGPQITSGEFRIDAWVRFVNARGRVVVRTLASAVRTSHGWYIGTGFRRVEQPLPSGRVRVSRRRSWVTADSQAEAVRLLTYVAGRAA